MPRRWLICRFFCLLTLIGCSNEAVKPEAGQQTSPQRQAKKPPAPTASSNALASTQALQHLQNAEAYIRSGNNAPATQELDIINYASLSSEQRSKFNLLDAQIALSNGEAERALSKMTNIRPKLLNEADKINYYQSLAFAYSLTGNVIQGVTARIRLGNLLQNPQQQQDNVIAIMDMLNTLSIDALSVPQSSLDDLNGWMELAKIFKQRDQPGFNLDNQIAQWRQHYPSHPANPEFLKTYLTAQPAETPVIPAPAATAPTAPSAAGPTIAVLLPQTGALAQAGKALQDGILAAQQLAARSAPQPPLKFYDTEQNEIVTLYKQALADGAKQVIGPLVKEQIQVLADAVVFDVPVLALNHVEDLIKPNLYQFGLSPIDEAGQLALKAAKDGRKTASILTPDTSQGQRISQYLTIAWQSNGGLITGMQSYDPKQHDIADMLNALLGSTSITAQQGQPQTVFLSAFPDVAHELALQLKSRQNSDLAIYAMPNIYSGRPDPLHDADLGNINFCDIPWFFADYYKGPLNQTALQANWERLTDTQIRLLALGIDAYNILGRLTELQNSVYEGATGHLSLDSENRVTRKLVCAQFKGGIPAATGFIE